MRKQRIQDFIFHKLTMLFALSVLFVLLGIIISLIIAAIPAFREFGPGFITRIEWDPVNDQYGAMIAIVGTLVTSFIALLIAFPVGMVFCVTGQSVRAPPAPMLPDVPGTRASRSSSGTAADGLA